MQTSARKSRGRLRRLAWLVPSGLASLMVLSVLGTVAGCGGGNDTNVEGSPLPTLLTSGSPSPSPNPSVSSPTEPVSVLVAPSTATSFPGGGALFTATVVNSADQSVIWSVLEGPGGGTITTAGFYSAPTTQGTYHVVATSNADPTKSATATVTVQALPGGTL